MSSQKLAIVLSTSDRYRGVAELTRQEINRQWSHHPPVFLSGVEGADFGSASDRTDWMSTALIAVEGLLNKGYSMAYWILDDHPPVGRCQSHLLNEVLPHRLEQLQGVNIGLLGCGQRRGLEGQRVQGTGLLLNSPSYRWKFSLHPALWELRSLRDLLVARLAQFAPGQRTPWNFERQRDILSGPVSTRLLTSTYRVEGWKLGTWQHRAAIILKELGLWCFDAWRFALRIIWGQARREAFDRQGLWLYHWYLGPYPVFWSGAVRAGKPSPEFQTFWNHLGRHWMGAAWRQINIA